MMSSTTLIRDGGRGEPLFRDKSKTFLEQTIRRSMNLQKKLFKIPLSVKMEKRSKWLPLQKCSPTPITVS
jgi:hypothetical protein